MRNEKGFTLIELLAALTIATVVIGGAMMLLYSVNSVWKTSNQKFADESQVNFAMNTIAKTVQDATMVYYKNNGTTKELWIKRHLETPPSPTPAPSPPATSDPNYSYRYQLIKYDQIAATLTLYNVNNGTDNKTSISGSPPSTGTKLANNVLDWTVTLTDGSTIFSYLPDAGNIRAFQMTTTFQYKNGQGTPLTRSFSSTFKLLPTLKE